MATQIASASPSNTPVIRAAGGIIQRSTPNGDEVMIVYRKRHQDWTLPKGKVHEGESFQEAALREVAEETGCSCALGNYMGTISYADEGVPKVVMFWKMTVIEESSVADTEEIGEAVWMPAASAVQRLTHAQEKSLLSRVVTVPRIPPPAAEAEPAAPPVAPSAHKAFPTGPVEDRAQARLLREADAFRVELLFLERRPGADRSSFWAAAAHGQLDNVARCLESEDVEGGFLCLHAAQRYAVCGLNKSELMARAYILREEAQKSSSWRGEAIGSLLSVSDDELTPERVMEAMALRDEERTNQYYKMRLVGDHLRTILILCSVAVVALLPFVLLKSSARMVALSLLFGLLGACFSAVHWLMRGSNDSRISNVFVMLTPVLLGGVAGMAGHSIYEYAVWALNLTTPHLGGDLALAFLSGMLGQRVLARLAVTQSRRQHKK
jgi:8-oxo-dGTP pyrophosphatase MutT (NUDIX family)